MYNSRCFSCGSDSYQYYHLRWASQNCDWFFYDLPGHSRD